MKSAARIQLIISTTGVRTAPSQRAHLAGRESSVIFWRFIGSKSVGLVFRVILFDNDDFLYSDDHQNHRVMPLEAAVEEAACQNFAGCE